MTFFSLTYGINIQKRNKSIDDKLKFSQLEATKTNEEEQETIKETTFPNCLKLKNRIIKLEFKIKKLENSQISQKLKEKKTKIVIENLQKYREALIERLNLNSSLTISQINPLCSFEEMRKTGKYLKVFPEIMKTNYKFTHPTPIQSCVIPILSNKQSLIATSETGSGKTMSYLIPLVHNCFLNKLKDLERDKSLIILPTKELCKQIYNEFLIFSNYYTGNRLRVKYLNKSMLESIKSNFDNFLQNNEIIIATPKLALEFVKLENKIFGEKLLYLVLDEADKFFDYGFIEIIDEILFELKDINEICKGFFSATIVEEIENIITTHILNSVKISIGSSKTPAKSIYQKFIYCTNEDGKLIGIRNLIKDGFEPPMLIFVEGIHKLEFLYENIKYDLPKVYYLHSKMSKVEREDIVKKFRCGEIWILICTDLLSRGIDFKNVKSVLNYDCPYNPINYIHKIGRTGRAGREGYSFTFVIDQDIEKLKNLSQMLNEAKNHGRVDCPEWIMKLKSKNFNPTSHKSKNERTHKNKKSNEMQ